MLDDLKDYDEDRNNGALNAVAVAVTMDRVDYPSACAMVCDRAQSLLKTSIEHASSLPADCGMAIIEYAEKMQVALRAHRQPVDRFARQPHAG